MDEQHFWDVVERAEYVELTPDDHRVVLAALQADSEELSAAAADVLGLDMDDELAIEVVDLITRPGVPEHVRANAAVALGPALEQADLDQDIPEGSLIRTAPISGKTFARLEEALQRAYRDAGQPALVRRRVLEASVRAPRPWHAGAARAAWASGEPRWQATGLFCCQYLHGEKSLDAIVLEGLTVEDPDILIEAVEAAGERAMESAAARVTALARDANADEHVRMTAIGALGTIVSDETTAMLTALSASSDSQVACLASAALEEQTMWGDVPNESF